MGAQAGEDLFISSLTIAEIRRGIFEKPAGRKRRDLERWSSVPEGPQSTRSSNISLNEISGPSWRNPSCVRVARHSAGGLRESYRASLRHASGPTEVIGC